jgi:hypothetical protein
MIAAGFRTARVPGDWLLHPVPLAAALVLAINDRWLKESYAAWWTGKLSDFAGLLFFPLLLLSIWELVAWTARRPWRAGPKALLSCVLATIAVFTLVNVSKSSGALYGRAIAFVWYELIGCSIKVHHTVDPTDLLALPSSWLAWALAAARMRRMGPCD